MNRAKLILWWALHVLGFLWCLPLTVVAALMAIVGGIKGGCRDKLTWWVQVKRMPFIPKRFTSVCFSAIVLSRADVAEVSSTHLNHEREHMRQVFLFGILAVPLYIIGCIPGLMYLKPYRLNPFEVAARWKAGQDTKP